MLRSYETFILSEGPMSTFETTRDIPATAADVFAAMTDPERLARWWGPAGLTNTFSPCARSAPAAAGF